MFYTVDVNLDVLDGVSPAMLNLADVYRCSTL